MPATSPLIQSRPVRQLALALLAAATLVWAAATAPDGTAIARVSLASAWLCLLAITAALALGPLRLPGERWWKRLQRLAYAALLLTAVHGLLFQLLERRAAWAILLLAALCLGLVGLQLGARWLWRRQAATSDRFPARP